MADDYKLPWASLQTKTPADPWIGRTLAGHIILRKLGSGGMGVVYLARHIALNRLAAIKFLGAHRVHDQSYVELFLREARAAAQLNHPNILTVYEAGSEGPDTHFFIMEYVDGRDLTALQRELGTIPLMDAVRYTREAAAALAYAHGRNIIHQDIKPENLFLTKDGMIKVGDMGLAKPIGMDGSMTHSGWVVGSAAYISPERLKNPRDVDARTDIYSLGVTLHELVTGETPYQDASPMVIASQHLADHVPDPRAMNPNIDLDLCNIIQRMMAKNRDDRYQTMQEVVAVLADYQNHRLHPDLDTFQDIPEFDIPELKRRAQADEPSQPKDNRKAPSKTLLGLLLLVMLVWVGWKLLEWNHIYFQPTSFDLSIAGVPVVSTPLSTPSPPTAPTEAAITTPLMLANFNADDPIGRMRPSIEFFGNCNGGIVENAGFQQTGGWWIEYRVTRQAPVAESWFLLSGINASGYDALTFIVKSNGPEAIAFSVILQGPSGNGNTFVVDPVGPKWTLVRIPLSTFDLPSGDLLKIKIRFDRNPSQPSNGSITIDELALSPKQST